MSPSSPFDPDTAFRALGRQLAARRLRGVGLRARCVSAALALIVISFVYWQVRIPLDGLRRARGEPAALAALGGLLAVLAFAAGVATNGRLLAMRAAPPGPEWLALPAPPARVARHLRGEARWPTLAAAPLAGAVLLAGAGLARAEALVLLAALFALAWFAATGAGAAAAMAPRAGGTTRPAERALPPSARWLAAGAPRRRATRGRAPAWRASNPAMALARLDGLATTRPGGARARAAGALAFALVGLLAWWDGAEAMLRRAQAFVLFMPACVLLGTWAVQRACTEPASLHRPLPLSLRQAWFARAIPMAVVLLATTAANALAAGGLPVAARVTLVPAWSLPGVAVALLGLNYGLTLQPRHEAAETLYVAWLGAAVTASLMIPLLGWLVLLAGILHTSLRLRRWWAPEVGP